MLAIFSDHHVVNPETGEFPYSSLVKLGTFINLLLHSIAADAPVSMSLKHGKQQGVYFRCGVCLQGRVSLTRQLVFPANNGKLRTDEDFRRAPPRHVLFRDVVYVQDKIVFC